MTAIPIVLDKAGRVNTAPAVLRNELVTAVAATNPGYTANLPGSLIEDIASTDVGALVICDQAVTELINSITPYGANAFLLNQLGQIYGVQLGQSVNTSVYVIFTGTVGFVIIPGFTVSDGTYSYVVQDGGVIGSSGSSPQLFCVATVAGAWPVPVGTVNVVTTSYPSSVTLSVTNPVNGVPSMGNETEESYRARVLQAGLAVATGMPTLLKTTLGRVAGVQQRLISVVQQQGGGWLILVGGGDPYQVADAIFKSLFDISTLTASVTYITNVSNAAQGVVTTAIDHGLTTGQSNVYITGVTGMTNVNGGPYTIMVISPTQFSINLNTTFFPTYLSGGTVTPNYRNITVSLNDYPDVYSITFVNPPQQQVSISLVWNTISTNFVSPAAVASLGKTALADYINSIVVGQPINLYELQTVFQQSISSLISPQNLTAMDFSVSINGLGVAPEAGTGIIAGDPQSYFETTTALINVTQG